MRWPHHLKVGVGPHHGGLFCQARRRFRRGQVARTADRQSAIADISQIATLPEITLKVIQLVDDPESTASALSDVIMHDPALGARILKIVNSGFYGLPGEIRSISQAIRLIGLNALKIIAIAASLGKLFRDGQICPSFNARDLWTHCIAVAVGSKILSRGIGLPCSDEAFLAGLIHDIGIFVELQVCRPKLISTIEALAADEAMSFREAELNALGATHEQFGSALCRAWRFPPCFAAVAEYHHRPLEAPAEGGVLSMIVHVADITAARLQIGCSRSVEVTEIDPAVLDRLSLDPATLDEAMAEIPDATNEAAGLLWS